MNSSNANFLRSAAAAAALFSVFLFSFYVFSRTSLSDYVLIILGNIVPITWSMEIILVILIMLIVLIMMRNRENGYSFGIVLAWIFLVPSILSYSLLDPLKVIGAYYTLELLRPDLPFLSIVTGGIALAAVNIHLNNEGYLNTLKESLLLRGAVKEDLDMVLWKNYTYITGLLVLSCASSAVISIAAIFSETYLSSLAGIIPLSIYLLPIITAMALSTAILLYLYDRGQLFRTNSDGVNPNEQ